MGAYQDDCIIRAAEHLGQVVALLRMANTPESVEMARQIFPYIQFIEAIRPL